MTKREYDETIEAIRDAKRKATASKKAARAYLRKVGIVNAKGELTDEYRNDVAA